MPENTDAVGAQGASDIDKAETQTQTDTTSQELTLSNSDAKKLPWVKEMAEELNTLRREKADRAEAEAQAAREAEIKAEQEKGNFEKALKMKEEEAATRIAELESKILQGNLTTALLGEGFPARAAKLLMVEYDAETHGDPAEYAKACLADEANAPLLGTQTADPTKPAPPGKPVKGKGSTDWEQVKAWEKNGTREEKAKAAKLVGAHKKQTGSYPYERDW